MIFSGVINIIKKAIEKASVGLVRDFGELEKLQVSKRGQRSFVTSSDKNTEGSLMYHLEKAMPDVSFWCEESGVIQKVDKKKFWIIDPIDGTTNFMRGLPLFAVNVAFAENDVVTSGVTYEPIRGTFFCSQKGEGAFSNRQRLRVSSREDFEDSLAAVRVPISDEEKLFNAGVTIRKTGSIALDFAYFSAGRYDFVISKDVGIWDIAPGVLLTRESGGFLELVKKEDGSYSVAAASSKKLLDKILNLIHL